MIKLFLKEYLDEMSTVCRDNKNNVSIAVNPDSERQGHPYFKFYNNVYYGDAAKVVRILFNSADYVENKNAEDQKLWKLSHKEKKLLKELLSSPSAEYSDMTIWEACKFEWNFEYLEQSINLNKYVNKKKSTGKIDMIASLINAMYLLEQDQLNNWDFISYS